MKYHQLSEEDYQKLHEQLAMLKILKLGHDAGLLNANDYSFEVCLCGECSRANFYFDILEEMFHCEDVTMPLIYFFEEEIEEVDLEKFNAIEEELYEYLLITFPTKGIPKEKIKKIGESLSEEMDYLLEDSYSELAFLEGEYDLVTDKFIVEKDEYIEILIPKSKDANEYVLRDLTTVLINAIGLKGVSV